MSVSTNARVEWTSALNAFAQALVCCLVLLSSAGAAPVHVKVTDGSQEKGGGFTIRNGDRCYAVTAAHVVNTATDIVVIDQNGREEKAKIKLAEHADYIDLALLSVEFRNLALECSEDWPDAAMAKQLIKRTLNSTRRHVVARVMDDTGRLTNKDLTLESGDDQDLVLVPARDGHKIEPGDSGSPIYADGELIGIIRSVDKATGRVMATPQTVVDGSFRTTVIRTRRPLVALASVNYGNKRHHHATDAARQFFRRKNGLDVADAGSDRKSGLKIPNGASYVVRGDIRAYKVARQANPNYAPPSKGRKNNTSTLLDEFHDAVVKGQQQSSRKSAAAKYINTYSLDIEFRIDDLKANNSQVFLFSHTENVPIRDASEPQARNVVRRAVQRALRQTVEEHPNLSRDLRRGGNSRRDQHR